MIAEIDQWQLHYEVMNDKIRHSVVRVAQTANVKCFGSPKTRVILFLKRLSFLSGFGAMYVVHGVDLYIFSLWPDASIGSPGAIGRFELSVSTSVLWH
jgi:hypothetical protein